MVGGEERVRRKSPTEATFPEEPLKSESFTTVLACWLEEIELTIQGALLSHTSGKVLSGSHLRGVFGKYHLSKSYLQLLIQPPTPPRDKGRKFQYLTLLWGSEFKSSYRVKELPWARAFNRTPSYSLEGLSIKKGRCLPDTHKWVQHRVTIGHVGIPQTAMGYECLCTRVCGCVCTHMYVCACMCTHVHSSICACMCVCTHA